MRKLFRFAVLVILGSSFAAPLLASAISCPSGCSEVAGQCQNDYNGGFCAATATSGGGVNLGVIAPYSNGVINFINDILAPILLAVAFITFLWGVYRYFILGADNDTERATGRQFVLWGILGFVVIFSLWALVNLVRGTLGFPGDISPPAPPLL